MECGVNGETVVDRMGYVEGENIRVSHLCGIKEEVEVEKDTCFSRIFFLKFEFSLYHIFRVYSYVNLSMST